MSPTIAGSQTCLRSGSKGITTSGAPCERAACRSVIARATLTLSRKFRRGQRRCPHCLRNPLYHWTHLELKRYFGIDDLLDGRTADSVWARANEQLKSPTTQRERHSRKILREGRLYDRRSGGSAHPSRERSPPPGCRRRCIRPSGPIASWILISRTCSTHGSTSFRRPQMSTSGSLPDLLDALRKRHQAFHDIGGRLSDHGLDQCYAADCSDRRGHVDLLESAWRHAPQRRRNARRSRRT